MINIFQKFQKQKDSKKITLVAFFAIVILSGFSFTNQAFAGYSATTSFESPPVDLTSSYNADPLVLQADISTGITISTSVRACLRDCFRSEISTQHLFCVTKKVLGGNF